MGEFLQELRAAFKAEAASSGKPELLISAAVAAGTDKIKTAYEIPEMSNALDFINVMTYDFHGAWEKGAGHNSPLYAAPTDTGVIADYNIDTAIKFYISQGADPQKLNLGLATYGRNFELSDPSNHDVGAPIKGAGPAGVETREKGFNSYYEICEKLKAGAQVIRDPTQQVPYAVKGNEWIGFDDEQSLRNKVDYARANGLGGIMFWALDLDDFKGQSCGKGPYPLMNAAKDQCLGGTPGATFTQAPYTQAPYTNAPATTDTTQKTWWPQQPTNAPSGDTTQKTWWPQQPTNAPITQAPTNAPWTQAPTNAPWTQAPTNAPWTQPPATTMMPTTTTPMMTTTAHIEHVQHQCDPVKDDFHPNPADCTTYFICTAGLAYQVKCATGLTFNAGTKSCDWPDNHACKLPAGAPLAPMQTTTTTTTTPAPTAAPTTPKFNRMTICEDRNLSDGIHKDPSSCHHFFECVNKRTVRLRCPAGTGFNPKMGICDYISHVAGCH